MPSSDWLPLPVVDVTAGTVTLSLWAAGLGVVLLAAGLFLAVFRTGAATVIWASIRIGLVLVAAIVGWAFLERLADRDRADERRALDQRMQELTTRATIPGSLLGCLDVSTGDTLQGACEKAIFAGPDTVTAAVALVSARLSLLADAADYANRVDSSYNGSIVGLRRAIEDDPFGLVAYVLASRQGCTNAKCGQLALVSDATRVSANLRDGTFDALVARYASGWVPSPRSAVPVAAANAPGPGIAGVNFPSAASIPPVNIMTTEPAGVPPPAADATPPAAPPPAAQPRRAGGRVPGGRAQQAAPTAPPAQHNAPSAAASAPPRAQ